MKDFKYILKRVVIGVLIALVLSFIRYGSFGMVVKARTISSYSMGIHQDNNLLANNSGFTIFTNSYPWANSGDGYLTFSFVLYKNGGGSTDANALIRNVNAKIGDASYACSIGTTTVGNSTFNNGVYSATCPVYFDGNGLTGLTFGLSGQGSSSTYTFYFSGLMTFEQKESSQTDMSSTNNAIGNMHNAINHQTQDMRDNINNQTNSINNNNNTNTQNIINNQNTNTQQQIESQKACTIYDNNYVVKKQTMFNSSGSEVSINYYGITDYVSIVGGTIKSFNVVNDSAYTCFYNANKVLISCVANNSMTENGTLTIPTNSNYVRFSIQTTAQNKPRFEVCLNGNQAIVDSQKEINNTINNDDVTDSTSQGSDFFNNFSSNSHGLSGVITAPLRLVNALTTASCSPLSFNLPFVHNNVSLPCMRPIYENHFGVFFSLYQLITTGLICYATLINLYSKIHNLQNPNNDRIEVLNL